MILNSMKSEFRYDIRSKFLIIITLLLSSIMCAMVYIQYVQVDSTMSVFRASILNAEENGSSAEEQLARDFEIPQMDNDFMGFHASNNPLAESKYFVEQDLKNMSMGNAMTGFCGMGHFYLPIIFSMIGLLSMRRDVKYKLLKIKVCKYGKNKYVVSKLLYLTLITGLVLLISVTFAMIANRIAYYYALKEINEYIIIDPVSFSLSRIVAQFCFTWFWSLIYLYLGVFFSQLTHNTTIGAAALIALIYMVPLSFKYDPRNIIFCYVDKFFDFYGESYINYIDVSSISILIVVAIMVISIIMALIINQLRSAYI